MKFRDLSFIVVVVAVVAGLQALSRVNKPPAMPKDIHHAAAGRDARAQCLRCHHAETLQALEQMNRHTAKWRDERFSCLRCHVPASPVSVLSPVSENSAANNGDRRWWESSKKSKQKAGAGLCAL